MTRVIPDWALRNSCSAILREVQAGESFDITINGEVVARLVPPTERSGLPTMPMRKATRTGEFAGLPRLRIGQPTQDIIDDLRGDR